MDEVIFPPLEGDSGQQQCRWRTSGETVKLFIVSKSNAFRWLSGRPTGLLNATLTWVNVHTCNYPSSPSVQRNTSTILSNVTAPLAWQFALDYWSNQERKKRFQIFLHPTTSFFYFMFFYTEKMHTHLALNTVHEQWWLASMASTKTLTKVIR